jgi:L-threonylcarbamoyladenylate synthase
VKILPATDESVIEAAAAIRRGDLVVIPTETVYGLAADASNPKAIAKVFAAKGRPAENPLIVHIASISHLTKVARTVPQAAKTG